MKTDDFDYPLPDELIAQYPLENRGQSRLMVLAGGAESGDRHLYFRDFHTLCKPEDLLVLNDTRVIPARLILRKASGGRVEVMLERFESEQRLLALVRSNKPLKVGAELILDGHAVLRYLEKVAGFGRFQVLDKAGIDLFRRHGQVPLPPYIQRPLEAQDAERYQTVYAYKEGAVAAPTAGLHFDQTQFDHLKQMNVQVETITLHVGAGTFVPVKVADVKQHTMHYEHVEVSQQLVDKVQQTRRNGGRVIAVGTTTVRALESAAQTGELQPYSGGTQLFIYPGYEFQVVDALVTNFHLPKSTLLMMVSAFVGKAKLLAAYRCAIAQKYRFFSYGDAQFMQRQRGERDEV